MNSEFEAILDECLAQIRQGASAQHCLERHPEYRDALAPLLAVAVELGHNRPPAPLPARRAADRQRVLAQMEAVSRHAAARSTRWHHHLTHWLRTHLLTPGNRPAWKAVGAVLIAVLLLTSGVTVGASTPSLPGDRLYPIKLTAQRAQLALTFDADRRQILQEKYDLQKLQEIRHVLSTERRTDVEFQGILQEKTDQLWQVGGLSVIVNSDTQISGIPKTDSLVLVKGYLPGDGSIVAERLIVRDSTGRATPASPSTATPDDDEAPPKPTATPMRPTPNQSPTPDEKAEPTESASEPDQESAPSDDGEQDEMPAGHEADDKASGSDDTQDPEEQPTEVHEEDDREDGTPDPESDDDSGEDDDEEHEATPSPDDTDDGDTCGEEECCTPPPPPPGD